MAKQSAGILVYRKKNGNVEVFLVHPGGPFWAKKDDYAWSIPKGLHESDEDSLETAKREFKEEVGQPAPKGDYEDLGSVKLKSGKEVRAWAAEKDLGDVEVRSNTFTVEWPPKSGKEEEFPEVDKAAWFEIALASHKIHPGQSELLLRLGDLVGANFSDKNNGKPLNKKLNDTQISLL